MRVLYLDPATLWTRDGNRRAFECDANNYGRETTRPIQKHYKIKRVLTPAIEDDQRYNRTDSKKHEKTSLERDMAIYSRQPIGNTNESSACMA